MKVYRTIGFEPIIWLKIQEICDELICDPEQFLVLLITSYYMDYKQDKENRKNANANSI